MEIERTGQIRESQQGFDGTLRSLKQGFRKAGLTIVQQFSLSDRTAARKCVLLLVDSPLLLFEAVALDRSAAAFLPLHVVVTGDQQQSRVRWGHPMETLGFRLSPTATAPVEALYSSLTEVIGAVVSRRTEVESNEGNQTGN